MFTRFYYKGLMLYMKNKNKPIEVTKVTFNTNPNPNTNTNENTNNTNENNNNINNANNTNMNKTNEVQKKEEPQANNNNENNSNTVTITDKNEQKPVEQVQRENRYTKARGLRKLLNKRGKEKLELLRKYFYKFQQAGMLVALRKGTKRASLLRQVENVDLETAFNKVVTNKGMNEIEVDETSNAQEFKEALDKKMEDKQFAEEMEKIKLEEERKRKEEEERKNELYKQKLKHLEILFYKADRKNRKALKKYFEVYNLKTKILSLNVYEKPRRTKTKKARNKRKSLLMKSNSIIEKADLSKSQSVAIKRSNSQDKEFDPLKTAIINENVKEEDENSIDEFLKNLKETEEKIINAVFDKDTDIEPGQYATFDGKKLTVYQDGKPIVSWDAVSGRPGYQTPEHQDKKDTGPIPAGIYVARQSELQFYKDISWGDRQRSAIGFGTWRGGTDSWGNSRVWLDASKDTNTYGRSGFSIHGGAIPGSAGCIDLTSSMDDFTKWFENNGHDLIINVKY